MRKVILTLFGLFILDACLILVLGAYLILNREVIFGPQSAPIPVAVSGPTNGPTPPLPTPVTTSTPEPSNPSLDELLRTDIPRNDPLELARELRKASGTFATPAAPAIHKVGDQDRFWVSRDITGTFELITATLRYVTPHSYMWVENGENVSDSDIQTGAQAFENRTYPTDRKYFGSEPNPGVDGDPHVYILNTHFTTAIAGYYSPADEYPDFVNRFSNQHEIFYMNLLDSRPGTQAYEAVLAHEFAHMIHWNENKREGSWITEGFGDLAEKLNGFPQSTREFAAEPDLQLNAWGQEAQAVPHYEASYLFLSYLLNRFGDNFIRDMIASGTHDILTVQKALDEQAPGLKFDDVFADWTIANYINDRDLGSRYSYLDTPLQLRRPLEYSKYPVNNTDEVHQYGTDYIQFDPAGSDVTFSFQGGKDIQAFPTEAHSGKSMWWGNRADESDTTLTREFDLTGVQKATLKFWTWYDIEPDFDYGYVEVSTDNGSTWNTLAGNTTTNRDPNGANYGNGLTCKSVSGCAQGAPPAQWVQEQMDLTPYVGKKILLRFQYITDAIYAGFGFVIDDITIPEIGFADDADHGDNGWQAHGFVRFDNTLPQRFLLQAIEFGRSGQVSQIVQIPLDSSNRATFTTHGFGKDISKIVIAISANTPVTWLTAKYRYTIQ